MVSGRRKRRTLRIGETPLNRQSLVHNLGVFASWRELFFLSRVFEAVCLAHDLGHAPFGHAASDSSPGARILQDKWVR